jgi:hypothetical protein
MQLREEEEKTISMGMNGDEHFRRPCPDLDLWAEFRL